MINISHQEKQVKSVNNFKDFVSSPFHENLKVTFLKLLRK